MVYDGLLRVLMSDAACLGLVVKTAPLRHILNRRLTKRCDPVSFWGM